MSCLYSLNINLLSVMSFANIFFHSVDFCSISGFLCCEKTFKFNQVLFVQFCFYFLAFILLSLLQQNEHVICYFIHSFFSDTVPFHLLHNSYNNLPFSLHLLIVVCFSYQTKSYKNREQVNLMPRVQPSASYIADIQKMC